MKNRKLTCQRWRRLVLSMNTLFSYNRCHWNSLFFAAGELNFCIQIWRLRLTPNTRSRHTDVFHFKQGFRQEKGTFVLAHVCRS